jgi:hypothetical protein
MLKTDILPTQNHSFVAGNRIPNVQGGTTAAASLKCTHPLYNRPNVLADVCTTG